MKNLCTILIICLALVSCSEKDMEASIEYYITAKKSLDIDALSLSFHHARAMQMQSNGETMIRTVLLGTKSVKLDTKNEPSLVLLGSSNIGTETIYGYDILFSDFSVEIDGQLTQVPEVFDYDFYQTELQFKSNEKGRVIFEIDLDNSLLESPSGELSINPIIEIKN